MGWVSHRFGDTKIARYIFKVSILIAVIGAIMGLVGMSLIGATLFSRFATGPETTSPAAAADCDRTAGCGGPVRYKIQRLPSPTRTSTPSPTLPATATPLPATPTATPTVTPTVIAVVSPTVVAVLTGTKVISEAAGTMSLPYTGTVSSGAKAIISPLVTTTPVTKIHADAMVNVVAETESYTSTNQVTPPPSAGFVVAITPTAAITCPVESSFQYDLIPIEDEATRDHPDEVHGDLNLALRGYVPVSETLETVFYNGNTDGNAPRLHGLFAPNRQAEITSVYQVNDWIWDPTQCGGHPRGCPGPPSEELYWPVTMIGLAVTPGETLHIPERGPAIYPGGYIAMVLYAEEKRITLGYTRRDTAGEGYVVHLENLCVDPNLVAVYRAQMDAAGWHTTGRLPALRNNVPLGTALAPELRVAIRDAGTFMDPRSRKDWWE